MTKDLVKQRSWKPTRKVISGVIAGAIVGATKSIIDMVWPGHPFDPYFDSLAIWVAGAVAFVIMYFTKDEKNV